MNEFETYPIKFANRNHFECAVSTLNAKAAMENKYDNDYDIGYSSMIINFFSAENMMEMKQLFLSLKLTLI
jgi:hypothetical protein